MPANGSAPDRQLLNALKAAVRAAWCVFSRLPDADARFRKGLAVTAWTLPVVREPGEYGRHPVWQKTVASPQDVSRAEIVFTWLAWLRRQPGEGEIALKRIIGWARGVPMYVLAHAERRCTKTIENRIDRSMAAILKQFLATDVDVEIIDEPPASSPRVTSFTERPTTAGAPDSLEPGKVYIAGIGMMFHGKHYVSPEFSQHPPRQRRR